MAKSKKSKRKPTAQNRKFAACVKKTFSESTTPKDYGRRMSACLKK